MIYFDHAAAVRPTAEILDFYRASAERAFFNQEAAHAFAYGLRQELLRAGETLSLALTGKKMRVYWGSSGTDVLWAASQLFRDKKGKIACSEMVHPAVDAVFADQQEGEKTLLQVFPHVESETGLITPGGDPAAETGLVLCDAIQSAGKLFPLPEADLIAVSGNKLGGMGGGALLYQDPAFETFFARMRAGHRVSRPEPAQCLTLAHAATLAAGGARKNTAKVREIALYLREKLTGLPLPGGGTVRPTLPPEKASWHILHFLLPGIQTGVLVRMLGERGVACSAGSACAAETTEPSRILRAMGHTRDAYSGLRLSFSPQNTPDEAEAFVRIFQQAIKEY